MVLGMPIHMAKDEVVALPVAVLPRSGECSRSLLLRAATANGLGMEAFGRLVGMNLYRLIDDQPSQLASLLGVGAKWFCEHLVTEVSIGRVRRWRAFGQIWTAEACLRSRRPQVCPECLAATQYCQAVWNVTGYAVCARHGLALEAHCSHCKKPIGWDRPAINVCRCGWMLGRGGAQSSMPVQVVAWSRWVARQTGEAGVLAPTDFDGEGRLPRWIQGLTVDGAFQSLLALGLRHERFQRISSSDAVKVHSPVQLVAILGRGIERGGLLDAPSVGAFQALNGWVYEEGLERLARRAHNDADRVFAKTLVQALKRVNYRCRATGRRPVATQGDLFEGCDA